MFVTEFLKTSFSLEAISLNHNAIASIPSTSGLTSLISLGLAYNHLAGTFQAASLSSSLENLDIGHNAITSLGPSANVNLTNLVTLELSYNMLSTLDNSWLGSCASLRELRGEGNRLTSYPTDLTKLPLMELIDLAVNQITIPLCIELNNSSTIDRFTA